MYSLWLPLLLCYGFSLSTSKPTTTTQLPEATHSSTNVTEPFFQTTTYASKFDVVQQEYSTLSSIVYDTENPPAFSNTPNLNETLAVHMANDQLTMASSTAPASESATESSAATYEREPQTTLHFEAPFSTVANIATKDDPESQSTITESSLNPTAPIDDESQLENKLLSKTGHHHGSWMHNSSDAPKFSMALEKSTSTMTSAENYASTAVVPEKVIYSKEDELLTQSTVADSVTETFEDVHRAQLPEDTEAEAAAAISTVSHAAETGEYRTESAVYRTASSSGPEQPTLATVQFFMSETRTTPTTTAVDFALAHRGTESVTTLLPATNETIPASGTTISATYRDESESGDVSDETVEEFAITGAVQANGTEENLASTTVPSFVQDTKDEGVPLLTTVLEVKSKDDYAMTAQLLSLQEGMLMPSRQRVKHGKKTSPASVSYTISDGTGKNSGKKGGGIRIIQNFDIFINPTANITKSTTYLTKV
ncbi:mucin-2-like [Ornithodoros turicata]|uniref:mucin-2-like n=1 Tax=Ornithodoros turicata TaxID=34597 RepID=UPI0031393A09